MAHTISPPKTQKNITTTQQNTTTTHTTQTTYNLKVDENHKTQLLTANHINQTATTTTLLPAAAALAAGPAPGRRARPGSASPRRHRRRFIFWLPPNRKPQKELAAKTKHKAQLTNRP
jgi:hypothetical protein